jgi:tetratricopeptide (TPR) repeat protein
MITVVGCEQTLVPSRFVRSTKLSRLLLTSFTLTSFTLTSFTLTSFDPSSLTLRAQDAPSPSPAVQAAVEDEAATNAAMEVDDAELRLLVAELGNDEFVRRENAQQQLRQFGIDAFDVLREAKDDPDIEISRRVRYLLRRLDVIWYQPSDSPTVKEMLEKYAALSKIDRATRVHALASLPVDEAIPVLCRIARLETEDRVAKQAATSLIRAKYFSEPAARRKQLSVALKNETGYGKRKGILWLRIFADSLQDPQANVERWRSVVANEQKNYANYPATSSNSILLDLLRFETEALLFVGKRDDALKSAQQAMELVDPSRQELLTHIDWMLDREMPELVLQIRAKYPEPFGDDLALKYRFAEAHRNTGDDSNANQAAKLALEHRPDDYAAHLVVAKSLENRGMFDWAEAEYRFVAGGDAGNQLFAYRARIGLSEMLHDQFQDQKASDVLKDLFAEIDTDPQKLAVFRQYRTAENGTRSRMYYFQYLAEREKGDVKKQKEALENGFRADPDDADLLIGVYRFAMDQEDEAFKSIARERVRVSAKRHLDTARSREPLLNDPRQANSSEIVAHYNNQYAWLVANTTGDYDEALRRSRQSVDLLPDASGYWDTLARCHFAKGDYANAVKYQEHAAAMEPHSGQIKKQLQTFTKALADHQTNGKASVKQDGE